MEKVRKYSHYVIAIIILALVFNGTATMVENAERMEILRSQGGTSVAEAYYQMHGSVLIGQATVFRGLGVAFAATIIYLGELVKRKASVTENSIEAVTE